MTFVITQQDVPGKSPSYFMRTYAIRGMGSGASWTYDPKDAARYGTRKEAQNQLRKIKAMYPERRGRYFVSIAPLAERE